MPSTFNSELFGARAIAINHLELPKAVGWVAGPKGALWERIGPNPTDWTATLFDNLLFGDSPNHWKIWWAHDINDSNWVVAIAEKIDVSPSVFCTVLLTPGEWPCPLDVTQDGCVNNGVLIAIIADYGRGISYITNADVNGDSIVNIADLLAVIAAWCSDQSAPCCQNCPGGEGLMGGSSAEAPSVAELIELVMGSGHSSELQSEIILDILEHFDQ